MRLEFQTITPMSVQIPIFIGEVGQSEVSDDLVHSLKPSKSNFFPARVCMGARLFRGFHAFRVPQDHSNEFAKHRLEKHVHFSFLFSRDLHSVKGGAKQGCTRHDVKNVHNSYNFKHVRNTYSLKTCTECVHLLKGKHLPRKQYEIRTIVRSAYVVA